MSDRVPIRSATVTDFREVIDHHARYWGARDLRALHPAALIHHFPQTCLVAAAGDGIRGYLFGFVTPDRIGYAHLIATRDDARGSGLGRRLYDTFTTAAQAQGAVRLAAITTPGNEDSIAFHRRLGFDARMVADYDGPGADRAVFTREL